MGLWEERGQCPFKILIRLAWQGFAGSSLHLAGNTNIQQKLRAGVPAGYTFAAPRVSPCPESLHQHFPPYTPSLTMSAPNTHSFSHTSVVRAQASQWECLRERLQGLPQVRKSGEFWATGVTAGKKERGILVLEGWGITDTFWESGLK